LLIDSDNQAHIGNKAHFSFETSWLKHENFYEIVKVEWEAETRGNSPIAIWQNKIRHLRRFLKGWAKCLSGQYKKQKEKLLLLIDELDLKAEYIPLDNVERTKLRKANDDLTKLRRDEESKWAQRAKVKYIQEGGNNTKYFHLIANGKHRRKKKFQLEQEEGIIVGDENLQSYISEYYKKLFGEPVSSTLTLSEEYTQDIPQLTQEENNILIAEFT
jgi:hypothetical protein